MVLKKNLRIFNDVILDNHPDLKESLKPNDHYPELDNIAQKSCLDIPDGSLTTKLFINKGLIVGRVFKTPNGNCVSLFSNSSNVFHDSVPGKRFIN